MSTQTQLQSIEMKQRKKCRGNRKLQRFRRRCRRNQINHPLMEMLMTSHAVIQQFHSNDHESNEEEEQIDNKTCLNQHQSMEENHAQQTTTPQLSIDKWKLSTKMIPNYNKFPTHLFKHLLYKAIPCYRQQIHQYLKNPKLLSFIQQYAHLICTILQLEMEKDYWKHAINGLLSAVNWLSQMSKDLTRRNSVNWDYPRTEHNIRHRQQLTENKLQRTTQELQLHLQQYSFCWSMSNQTLMNRTISQALIVVIENGLQKLHSRFEQKKILMQFDIYDIYLVKSFYDLNPTEEQKQKIEKIWRVKRKSCQRTIHQIKANSLENKPSTVQDDTSSIFKGNSRLYIDYDYEQDQVSFLESLSPIMRTIIETRQANMEKRTQQIIAFQNNTASSSSH